eukprot:scaffold2523_cov193-Skeletonema_menzelii.AAC.10
MASKSSPPIVPLSHNIPHSRPRSHIFRTSVARARERGGVGIVEAPVPHPEDRVGIMIHTSSSRSRVGAYKIPKFQGKDAVGSFLFKLTNVT